MQVASDNYEVVIKVNPLLLLDPINRQYTEWLKEELENSDHRDLWLLLTLGGYAYVVPLIDVWSRNINKCVIAEYTTCSKCKFRNA